MISSKKLKFSLNLDINELSNIPQINGSCFLELHIRNHKKHGGGLGSLKSSKSILSDAEKKYESKGSNMASLVDGNNKASFSSSSGQVTVTSSKKRIHNFRCPFNLKVSCNLKIPLKKKESMVANKYLLISIYYVEDTSKDGGSHHHLHQHTSLLGKVSINLSEYLNFDKPVSSKYLLRESKVNSILNLTIGLTELPENYEFHTQLQVSDSSKKSPSRAGSGKQNRINSRQSNFNAPQFERKKVFGGIQDVIENSATIGRLSSLLSRNSSDDSVSLPSSKRKNGNESLSSKVSELGSKSQIFLDDVSLGLVQPIVSDLYNKILESKWDPDICKLLEYSPEKCVEDIFDNADNKSFVPDIYNQRKYAKEENKDGLHELNGLINELDYRDDLQSWTIGDVT
ncbi:uncharacterized protein PRCAT00003704001 [Priceomyces carsonii]|uniref:uncharacterized protein n=1 Tax=Priceomyces carsonii TaxID=28549 RepID=UPI002ED83124|nr:unnamed protein product [Priceomyces carsonii]